MDLTVTHMLLLNLILIFIVHSVCRSTEKQNEEEEGKILHLFVKRDTTFASQELPYVDGRTHRASNPLNPDTQADSESHSSHALLGGDFETSHSIFQPEVDDAAEDAQPVQDGGARGQTGSAASGAGYSAQYPYAQTSSDGQSASDSETVGSRPESQTSSSTSGSETLTTRRRVQTYGSTSGSSANSQGNAQRRVVAYGGDGSSSYDTGHQTQTQSRFVAYGSGGTDSQRPGYQTQSQGRVVAYGGSGSSGGQEQSSQTHSQRVIAYGGGGTTNEGHTSQTNSQRVVAYGGGSAPRQGLDSHTHSQRVVAYGSSNPSNQGQGSQTHSQQVVAYSGGTGGSDTSYQPSGSSTSYQLSGSGASYQPSGSGTSYQPSGSGAAYQPSGSGTSYQPRGSSTFYQPTGSRTRTSTGRGNYYRTYPNSRPRGTAGRSRQYVDTSGRIVYTGGSSSTSGSGQPGSNGISYQNGRYYDAAGHEVDQYGRHLGGSGGLVGSTSNGEACCDDSTSQGLPSTYNPIISQISDDPNCPETNVRVRINGLTCTDALHQLGHFVCYNYERVSTECCEKCLQIKRPSQKGCEYGDRSYQCRNIQPFDCYVERNRQICCERCEELRQQMQANARPGCAFGDLTPRCQSIRQRPHLCYLPENQRLCCNTCPMMANEEEPNCRWGNQSPELCSPFDQSGKLKLNCYIAEVQEVCCATCKRLRARMRDEIPGCEYGDAPVQFSTGRAILDCAEYIRDFGVGNCNDPEIASKCCYTCHRYRSAGRG